ncbi:MAG: hypothetical protein ACREXS_16175 [Gammaproteobacteria bacterium]
MSAEIRCDILEIEKLRQDIETGLARRHNWAEQEPFWAHGAKLNRGWNYIAVAAIAATIKAAIVAALVKPQGHQVGQSSVFSSFPTYYSSWPRHCRGQI